MADGARVPFMLCPSCSNPHRHASDANDAYQIPLRRLFASLVSGLSRAAQERLTRCVSALLAGWLSMKLLQTKVTDAFVDRVPPNTYHPITGVPVKSKRFAGRTIDLTLFAGCRALDVVIGELWVRRKSRRTAAGKWTNVERLISHMADPSMFAISSAFIMWAFIYDSSRLPHAYNNWIHTAAAVDPRLILALRGVRSKSIIYGKDTNQAALLESMCADYRWPLIWGNPEKTVPYPCEIVHMGVGPSCDWHALSRFAGGFKYALATYLPLNLLFVLRNPSRKNVQKAIISSLRSSSFLGAFIALYYYGICLTRSRFGPRVFGTSLEARQKIDGGVCIGAGCSLCGWSILLENMGRRKDIALFVAPRALATLLPRRYEMHKQWRETWTFALSVAVVATAVQEKPKSVRGVFGKLLGNVIQGW